MSTRVAAVDLGATSVRVAVVDLDAARPELEVVHRHAHLPVRAADGSLRWAWAELLAEVEHGLEHARATGPLASIGVDTWGVDYGLLDHRGRLLSPPHCYRSERTAGFRSVLDRIGERTLYERTGLQLQPFNTLFQLAAHDRAELAAARHALLLPDLVVHHLTGAVGSERTGAGTTGLLDLATGDWAEDLLDAVGARPGLLPPVVAPATAAGAWRGIPVHRVGGHDTASAVAAAPLGEGAAFVATGTWLLVGREQPAPDTSPAAQADNFANEQGVAGGIRFLKNLAGFWLLEECRRAWGPGAGTAPELVEAAGSVAGGYDIVDVTDPRFLAPDDMEDEVRDAAGIAPEADRAVVVRAIVESMGAGAAHVLDRLGGASHVQLLGGGAGVGLLADAIARHGRVRVDVGATEAAALGNALVQGIALGRWTDLTEARSWI